MTEPEVPEHEVPVVFFALRDAARIGFQLRAGGGTYLGAVRWAAAVVAARDALEYPDEQLVDEPPPPGPADTGH